MSVCLLRKLLYFVSLPTAMILIVMRPVFRVRFICLKSFRIGHYALNTELMLCAFDSHHYSAKDKTVFYNMTEICNTQLNAMWERVIRVFPFPLLASQIDKCLLRIGGKQYKSDIVKNIYESCDEGAIDRFGLLKKIDQSHLNFTQKEEEKAKEMMSRLGIPANAKYICLVVRDSGYLNSEYPATNWSYHDHRNADIATYEKAVNFLAEKGYYILRMGKHVNKRFEAKHHNIIDYATHSLRCDFMDIYLCATCFFCISTCTGLDCVSQIFRRPVLMTNISPLFSETLMWYPCTLFIPKLLKDKNTNQFLTLSETAKVCRSISKQVLADLARAGLELIENTENQLLDVIIEMEALLIGEVRESDAEKQLQTEYWENYKKHCPVPVENIYIKIGLDFLKNNNNMLH